MSFIRQITNNKVSQIGVVFALFFLSIGTLAVAQSEPTLEDFWEGRAEWVLDIADVGLPIGESDTVALGDGHFRSYLHASYESAGIVDSCGEPVEFPGCMTVWDSTDNGESFSLTTPICVIPCQQCPCADDSDHITAQQYPRVVQTEDTSYLAYEWHAQVMLRQSRDGLVWSDWEYLVTPGGTYPLDFAPCANVELIGEHPHIRGQADGCLIGAPPGIYVEGEMLYVFVTAGSAPSHMRCYKGKQNESLDQLQPCDTDPLFTGAEEYGDISLFGVDANEYFDFRYVSSADVMRVGDHYYMTYEGIRGPDELERGMDTQFGLGFARSVGTMIDGVWEKYPNNPILEDMTFNWGIGHADLIVIDDVTYLYTATSTEQRGRYRLEWKT